MSNLAIRPDAYNGVNQLYNFRGDNTARLHAGLGRLTDFNGQLKIAVVGDSIFSGQGLTPGGNDPFTYAQLALATYTSCVANAAVVLPCNSTGSVDSRWTIGLGWTLTSGFMRASAAGKTATFTSAHQGDVVQILYRGTSRPFTYAIDGGGAVAVAPTGASDIEMTTITGLNGAIPHSVVITSVSGGNNDVIAVGVIPSIGVNLLNTAQSGASSTDLSSDPSSSGAYVAAKWNPDVVFIECGLNDWVPSAHSGAGTTLTEMTTYKTNLTSIVNTVNTTGATTILVPAYYTVSTNVPTDVWLQFIQANYQVATDLDVPLLDLSDLFGSYSVANTNGLLQGDGVHPSADGSGAIARAIWRAIGST